MIKTNCCKTHNTTYLPSIFTSKGERPFTTILKNTFLQVVVRVSLCYETFRDFYESLHFICQLYICLRRNVVLPAKHTCHMCFPRSCAFHCSSSIGCWLQQWKAQRDRRGLGSACLFWSSSAAVASSSFDCYKTTDSLLSGFPQLYIQYTIWTKWIQIESQIRWKRVCHKSCL